MLFMSMHTEREVHLLYLASVTRPRDICVWYEQCFVFSSMHSSRINNEGDFYCAVPTCYSWHGFFPSQSPKALHH